LLLGTLAGVIAGCDETADEYHQQKVEQQLALFQSISGTYQGVVTTNGTPCDIAVELSPSVSPTNSSDGTTTVGISSLQGSVTLNCGTWTATEAIPTMEYSSPNNSQNGTFSGNFPVSVSSGLSSGAPVTAQMSISGSISGNQMTGTIDIDSQTGFTGTFNATKNAAPATAQGDTSGSVGGVTLRTYTGTYLDECPPGTVSADSTGSTLGTMTFTMTTELLPQEDNNFYNNFSSKKVISIQFTTQEQVMGVDDQKIHTVVFDPIGFQNATLDTQNHRLDGSQNGVGSSGGAVTLNCKEVQIDVKTQGWNCTLIGLSSGASNTFTAAPTPTKKTR
jgi:hypothetical protein